MVKRPKLRRRLKKAKEIVPEVVAGQVANLNPLNNQPDEPPKLEDIPTITTENIGEHREQVLKGARKYIYPLAHSKRRIIAVTLSVVIIAIISLLVYCSLALYKFDQYNTFVYRITQVVPFPIAKAGGRYVDYENYLFELRHYVHYYESQQQRDFAGADHQQLVEFRKQALTDVINEAYIKQLASQNHISVSDQEVNARLAEVRNQNRLGGNNKVFEDVLSSYWGWSINDFKRSLKQEMLSEKVAAKLDTGANQRADAALADLKAGANFTKLAKKVSDDPAAKSTGGDYGFAITNTNPNVPPEVINALFDMKVDQVSDIILASPILANQGPSLQIVKLTGKTSDSVTAEHIVFNLKDISNFIGPLEKQKPYKTYVHF
ncbi:MAG TPA: SurA N-terminal domain-containing protein [Candidatus Saccharimonadales bacterium]|nr:SurA N-terminal domain-containing protein [Candidatus Saccharimonadales bacterium]